MDRTHQHFEQQSHIRVVFHVRLLESNRYRGQIH